MLSDKGIGHKVEQSTKVDKDNSEFNHDNMGSLKEGPEAVDEERPPLEEVGHYKQHQYLKNISKYRS